MAACWVSAAAGAQPEPPAPLDFRGGAYFHPDLERAARAWGEARGAATLTALREVWQQWDRADPSQVEEVLAEASRSPKLSPPQRVYAELLAAYARLRRGDAHDSRRRIAALGYADQWQVVGPFDNTGKAGFEAEQGPEAELADPAQWERTYAGKDGRQVRWRVVPPAFPYGWVDAGALLRPRQPICAFFASHVSQPGLEQRRPATLWVGARGAFRLFFNGRERLTDAAYRGHDFDRRAASVWLEPGDNQVVVKVCGEGDAPMLSLRLGDGRGGPDAAVRWKADAEPAPRFAAAPPPPPLAALGALDWLERERRRAPTPELSEAFARYLEVTDGDDPALHQARDLARAAAAAPNVQRLLMVARLSDDRNERSRWIARARAELARTPPARLRRDLTDVLIAEAELAEQGPSPQLSLPVYEQALALDPDELRALSGKARLLAAAGLKHGALGLVEGAVQRNPHGVTLLNMYASGLGELGRLEEARAVESLYSALRFDDHGALVDDVDLAVAQRQPAVAERWLGRLTQLSPHGSWAAGVIARTQRALGAPERALATYERALALAPEDVELLRELSDLHGELGQRDEQMARLRELLGLEPQDTEARQYLAALEPQEPRADEAYAWKPEQFLSDRFAPAAGHHRRTLLDLTVTRVYENGLAGQFRQIVFQPLTDAGAAVGRQYAFTFQADRQRAQLRGARVYRRSGAVDEAIQSAEGPADSPELSMYTSARTVYVQFPQLEAGDVVELRYRVDDVGDRGEFAGYFGELSYLESEAPVAHAEYVVITPKDRRLYVDAQRVAGLEHEAKVRGDERVHVFRAHGLPGVRPEPAMPPWPEVLGFVHVSTFPSYQEIGSWYWGLSRDQLGLDAGTRELVQQLAAGKTTVREKVEAVYDWVVKNTRYVALEFGIYGYKPRRSVQTVSRGWGDCKDKAAVIVSMLQELGIDATLVLVRSGLRGRFQSQVASLAPFDHAIAYVPELDLYLDGTAEYSGTEELPVMDHGALALQVNEGKAKLVSLPENDPKTHVERREAVMRLDARGDAELDLSFEARGPSAAGWRQRYANEATRRARVLADLGQELQGLEISPGGLTLSDVSDYERPALLRVRGKARRLWRDEGGALSLQVTPRERLGPRFASLERRRLAVAIGSPAAIEERREIWLPEGHDVQRAPEPRRLESPFGSVSVEVERDGSKVVVESRIALAVSRVEPERYAEFRRFCLAADAALEQRLVLGARGR